MENKMDIKKAYDLLSDCARDWSADADWFDSMHAPRLSELYRFGHKAICDFIDAARAEDLKTVDDIDELFDNIKYNHWNMYKVYQKDHFDRLAELWRYAYTALCDAESAIERNK